MKGSLDTVFLGVTFLGRALQQATPAVKMSEAASILDNNTVLSRPAIEAFLLTWAECDKVLKDAGADRPDLDRIRQGGTIFGLKWKVGAIVSSSALPEELKDSVFPYVELSFNIRHLDGSVVPHSFQMTYTEFQDFFGQVKDAATAMDLV
jgi:hypothetical protein